MNGTTLKALSILACLTITQVTFANQTPTACPSVEQVNSAFVGCKEYHCYRDIDDIKFVLHNTNGPSIPFKKIHRFEGAKLSYQFLYCDYESKKGNFFIHTSHPIPNHCHLQGSTAGAHIQQCTPSKHPAVTDCPIICEAASNYLRKTEP